MNRFVIWGCFIFLCCSLAVPSSAQSSSLPIPVAPIGTHPRLLITTDYLNQVIQLHIETETNVWQAFLVHVNIEVNTSTLDQHPEAVMRSLALAWLLTEDTIYRDTALARLQQIVNWIEDAPVMTDPVGKWDRDFLAWVAALAITYDWMYPIFSSEDRAILADVLVRAATKLQDPLTDLGRVWVQEAQVVSDGARDEFLFQAFSQDDAQWLWTLTAVALVLQGERAEASLLIDEMRILWTDFVLPSLDIQPNGAWAAGPVDGFHAIWYKVQTALIWWTTRGENYFDDLAWWYDRLAYQMMLFHPDGATYPDTIGMGNQNDPSAGYGRTQLLLLRAVFAGTEYANWVDWFLPQTPATPWLLVEELLWRDPNALGEPPPTTTWRSFGTNHVFMRSQWEDAFGLLDTSAPHITFYAGDHLARGQFFDQGNFTIWQNGDELITRGGVYSGGDSAHDANYYGRTIGGNTILVCNLAETFDGIVPNRDSEIWLNDCGQRTVGPTGLEGINRRFLLADRLRYETGNIERMFDNQTITYIQADITAAYNSTEYTTQGNNPKVRSVIREFIYLRPSAVVVHDRVIALENDFTTITTLHFNLRPLYDGTQWIVREENATLYIRQLAPASQAEIVEGYVTAGQLVDLAYGEPITEQKGVYRMDTYPPTSTTTPWFLTTFVATKSNEPAPIVSSFIQGDGMRGTVVSTPNERWQLMFDDDPSNVTQATFPIEVGVQTLFITGLASEASYSLTWADGRHEEILTHGAGTLLFHHPTPGVFALDLGN